jgi:hypothetical protein
MPRQDATLIRIVQKLRQNRATSTARRDPDLYVIDRSCND